jgi:hypothetical protein
VVASGQESLMAVAGSEAVMGRYSTGPRREALF